MTKFSCGSEVGRSSLNGKKTISRVGEGMRGAFPPQEGLPRPVKRVSLTNTKSPPSLQKGWVGLGFHLTIRKGDVTRKVESQNILEERESREEKKEKKSKREG